MKGKHNQQRNVKTMNTESEVVLSTKSQYGIQFRLMHIENMVNGTRPIHNK